MVHIVTDSTASLPKELVEQYGIHVAPQIVNFGEEGFRAGVDLTIDEFYDRLAEAEGVPTTSQPPAGEFFKIFDPLVSKGDTVLAVVVSNELSGSYLSAQGAAEMLPNADIHVIDSRSVSAPLGFMVLEAARMAQAGSDLETIKTRLGQMMAGFQIYFLVDTLEYLRKGGRIGGAAALLGTALRLKPVLTIRDGRVESFERVRTKAKAVAHLKELVRAGLNPHGEDRRYLATVHGNVPEEGKALHAELVTEFQPHESLLTDLTPAIAVHSGPGLLAVAFFEG
jgi:DegV family protein with EDD domain